MLDGLPVGVLRLDRCDARSFEVSILIAPAWHGRGIGKAALAAARRLVPDSAIIAEVLAGNRPSHQLFRAAGFRSMTEDLYFADPLTPAVTVGTAAQARGRQA